jgi:DNA-binding response OmpR family regulator
MQTKHILIVDDDPAICILLQALLQRRQYDCTVVHDGQEAIRLLRRNRYSVILLDLMLPGTFGFDVIRYLQAEQPSMAERVIVMTAADEATLRHFDTSTIRALLHKPIDLWALVKHVEACAALDKPQVARAPSASPI